MCIRDRSRIVHIFHIDHHIGLAVGDTDHHVFKALGRQQNFCRRFLLGDVRQLHHAVHRLLLLGLGDIGVVDDLQKGLFISGAELLSCELCLRRKTGACGRTGQHGLAWFFPILHFRRLFPIRVKACNIAVLELQLLQACLLYTSSDVHSDLGIRSRRSPRPCLPPPGY